MDDCNELDILSVTTTVASLADAQRLARELVERRLAACVQLEAGLRSVYRWAGQVHDDPEVRIVVKTLPDRMAGLQAFFDEHHPYDVPQFLAVPMRASAAYSAWVRSEVNPP